MSRILNLPKSVVNRIAAGEVVERPASIVKELLENALDAAATRIDVTLEQGGVSLVRVSDDGSGIEPSDLPLAVAPHATSKLRTAEDLESIATFGFRGEALASIAEVSTLLIRSRQAKSEGASLCVDGGRLGEVVPEGCGMGTTIEVRQIFGNVPARRAFLRTPQTEWNHAADAFVRTALANPKVAFSLTHNGKLIHDLAAVSSFRERIGGLFGRQMAERLIAIESSDEEIQCNGLVGRPEDDQASNRLQYLTVVGRPFRDRSVIHAVQEAYRGLLLTGRHPIVFLNFQIPPDSVDVNVHPAKTEVRFRNPQRIYRLVVSSLRSTFLETDMGTSMQSPTAWGSSQTRPHVGSNTVDKSLFVSTNEMPLKTHVPDSHSSTMQVHSSSALSSTLNDSEGHVLPTCLENTHQRAVQMQNRYLVVEQGDGIEVIDQHALHERVLFERLKLSVDSGQLEVQSLLVPEQVDLGPKELELISEHASTLEKAGMRIQPFGGSTVLVSSKPVLAGTTSSEEIIREVIDRLAVASSGAETRMLVEEVLHSLACRSAIKAGDQLSQEEVDALIRDRHLVDDAHHCPHGRPTSLLLSKQELDKQFRRI